MELHLKIIGWLLILLSFMHVMFPRYFKWKQEFASVILINRQMMYVHTFFIALVVFLIGLLCITSSVDLIATPLGNRLAAGLFVFWSMRLVIQFFGYSSSLWKGKRLETIIHVLFSLLWFYMSVVFFLVLVLVLFSRLNFGTNLLVNAKINARVTLDLLIFTY